MEAVKFELAASNGALTRTEKKDRSDRVRKSRIPNSPLPGAYGYVSPVFYERPVVGDRILFENASALGQFPSVGGKTSPAKLFN